MCLKYLEMALEAWGQTRLLGKEKEVRREGVWTCMTRSSDSPCSNTLPRHK